jgi:hypothetical protein
MNALMKPKAKNALAQKLLERMAELGVRSHAGFFGAGNIALVSRFVTQQKQRR